VIALVVIMALFIAALLLAGMRPSASGVQAQETPASNMSGLLERLRSRMEADSTFSFSVHFVNPPIAGEPSWEIPEALSEAGARRTLGEIGDDYVCFVEQGQTFDDSVCIPYSNIKMLVYANEP
jgi:hypothetical protein